MLDEVTRTRQTIIVTRSAGIIRISYEEFTRSRVSQPRKEHPCYVSAQSPTMAMFVNPVWRLQSARSDEVSLPHQSSARLRRNICAHRALSHKFGELRNCWRTRQDSNL